LSERRVVLEREYKFSSPDDRAFENILSDKNVRVLSRGEVFLEAAYFDTKDMYLRALGGALRIRREGDVFVACLKLSEEKNEDSGVFSRREFECRAESIEDGLLRLPLSGADEALCRTLLEKGVFEIGRSRVLRVFANAAIPGATVQICLDRGDVSSGALSQKIDEIEIELLFGDSASHDAFCEYIRGKYGLSPISVSKFARVLKLRERGMENER